MKRDDIALQRLLRAAASAMPAEVPSAPFGFDTRIVALWRATGPERPNGIGRLVRRVAVIAAFVILISGAASFYEFQEAHDTFYSDSNEFAIADTAIENEFYR